MIAADGSEASEIFLGNFDIGHESVELYANNSAGGEFITNPVAQIRVGVASPDWSFVYQTVLHEAIEYAAFRCQARFTPDDDFSGDCGSFMFVMDHAKFSNVCGRVTQFLMTAMPAISDVWDYYHAPRTKGKLKFKR